MTAYVITSRSHGLTDVQLFHARIMCVLNEVRLATWRRVTTKHSKIYLIYVKACRSGNPETDPYWWRRVNVSNPSLNFHLEVLI
ncbi:hypothetical protein AOXY_G34827 [Acipenser oxyrinchus oxyrinchus]|uniref:Uncharacterized protein n=1 Tax=Acipenser oxyrinchus oxyrinchus TaxID=40147 RepID=A0AAD8CF69_ACIOX|nr:hypothetical protein AOXY_G34827 [Acipenser oxyrinchus oxyrinchus]